MIVYLRDLAKDIDYELDLPVTESELDNIMEDIGDYWIVDGDYDFNQYENIYLINEFAQLVEDLNEDEDVIKAIFNNYMDIEETIQKLKDESYYVFPDCNDMTDVAYQYIDETGGIENLGRDTLETYFDYESYGREMEIENTFIRIPNGYVEII